MSPATLEPRPTILLAEGLRDLREVLRYLLRDAAYEVTATGDGIEMISVALARTPDVLVLDLELQPLGGLLALEVLRAAGRDVPAVLLSPVADSAIARAAARLGVSTVLRKPFRNAELLGAITRCLAEREHRGPIRESSQEFPPAVRVTAATD